ncbi:MAG: hypothetical protein QW728_04410, partial [Thermoplasmata archaeon]
MDIRILAKDILSCVCCRGVKDGSVVEHSVRIKSILKKEGDFEIAEGFLECTSCKTMFPIIDGIAIMSGDWETLLKINGEDLKFRQDLSPEMIAFLGYHMRNMPGHLQDVHTYLYAQYRPFIPDDFNYPFWKLIAQLVSESGGDVYSHIEQMILNFPAQQIKKKMKRKSEIKELLACDFGCGLGRSTLDLSLKYQYVIGIDYSFEYLRRARRIVQNMSVKLPFICRKGSHEGNGGCRELRDVDLSNKYRTGGTISRGDTLPGKSDSTPVIS